MLILTTLALPKSVMLEMNPTNAGHFNSESPSPDEIIMIDPYDIPWLTGQCTMKQKSNSIDDVSSELHCHKTKDTDDSCSNEDRCLKKESQNVCEVNPEIESRKNDNSILEIINVDEDDTYVTEKCDVGNESHNAGHINSDSHSPEEIIIIDPYDIPRLTGQWTMKQKSNSIDDVSSKLHCHKTKDTDDSCSNENRCSKKESQNVCEVNPEIESRKNASSELHCHRSEDTDMEITTINSSTSDSSCNATEIDASNTHCTSIPFNIEKNSKEVELYGLCDNDLEIPSHNAKDDAIVIEVDSDDTSYTRKDSAKKNLRDLSFVRSEVKSRNTRNSPMKNITRNCSTCDGPYNTPQMDAPYSADTWSTVSYIEIDSSSCDNTDMEPESQTRFRCSGKDHPRQC